MALRISNLLVIIALSIFWYGLVPVAGAFISRHSWRVFRRRFDELRLRPLLDYGFYRRIDQAQSPGGEGSEYRFIGGFESVTDGHTLWIRGDTLTMPVTLSGAHTYVMPMGGSDGESFEPGEEVPERIRWDRVSALNEGARVFVGGTLVKQDDRLGFVSTKKNPLLVIFYDGNDPSLTIRVIRAGRNKNEYWNFLTPYAFIAGTFSLLIMASTFLSRPAFRLTAITAFAALFIPLVPFLPPGLLFTVLYRLLWRKALVFRGYRDLARLPLTYMVRNGCRLPDGQPYGMVYYDVLPETHILRLIPETAGRKKDGWYVFGALGSPQTEPQAMPVEPRDLFAIYGAIPGNPEVLVRRYTVYAYLLEVFSGVFFLAGMALNIFVIGTLILALYG
jgi:hypothetical protein